MDAKNLRRQFAKRLIFWCVVLCLSAVGSFGLVEFGASVLLGLGNFYLPILSLGMILPMALVLWLFACRLQAFFCRFFPEAVPLEIPVKTMPQKVKKRGGNYHNWMARESYILVLTSVGVYGAVEFFAYRVMNIGDVYSPILSIGMLLPMGLIVALVSRVFSKTLNDQLNKLVLGLSQVAQGDFAIRLDSLKAGPFSAAYEDFNRMSSELQSVQILKDDFINSFSHEFRTPIASIQGFAQLLLDRSVSKTDEALYLGIIASESARLSELAENTLLLSRLESQNIVLDKQYYSLDEQIRQCVILLSSRWTAKKVNLELDLKPVRFKANAELLQQLWINLLVNAIKFAPENGRVHVGLHELEGLVQVSVSDNGPGIAEEDIKKIFSKYYRGSNTAGTSGLGLGLTIVKRILDLTQGVIDVENCPGGGAKFIVGFPSSPQAQA